MRTDAATLYASTGGPCAADFARSLPDVGDALVAQLARLGNPPGAAEAEQVARNLDGAARAGMCLRAELLHEGEGHGC